MSKYTFLGLAAILLGAGHAAKAYAEGAEAPAEAPQGDTGEPKKRGRPAGSTNKPEEPAGGEPEAETDAQRWERNKLLIDPLVKAAQGPAVKAVIAKYSKTGLKDVPVANQAEFEKDIEALTF